MAIDHLNKWAWAKKIFDKKAENILDMVHDYIIKKHDLQKEILSDQSLDFDKNTAREYCRVKFIDCEYSSVYHHKTREAVERASPPLMDILRKMSTLGLTNCVDSLKNAIIALNISYNRSIETSPIIFKRHKFPLIQIDRCL